MTRVTSPDGAPPSALSFGAMQFGDNASVEESRNLYLACREHGITMLRSIWGWLVFGVLASAAITIWLPAEALTSVAGWGALGAGLAAGAHLSPDYTGETRARRLENYTH